MSNNECFCRLYTYEKIKIIVINPYAEMEVSLVLKLGIRNKT